MQGEVEVEVLTLLFLHNKFNLNTINCVGYLAKFRIRLIIISWIDSIYELFLNDLIKLYPIISNPVAL